MLLRSSDWINNVIHPALTDSPKAVVLPAGVKTGGILRGHLEFQMKLR